MSVIPDSVLHNPDHLLDDYKKCFLLVLRSLCDLFQDLAAIRGSVFPPSCV